MRRRWFTWLLCIGTSAMAQTPQSFEAAVGCIKRFEGRHTGKDYPYVGYGHKLLSGEKISSRLTEQEADSLLRSDLHKKCAVFRHFGIDSLLLS